MLPYPLELKRMLENCFFLIYEKNHKKSLKNNIKIIKNKKKKKSTIKNFFFFGNFIEKFFFDK